MNLLKGKTDQPLVSVNDLKEVLQVMLLLCDKLQEIVTEVRVLQSGCEEKIKKLEGLIQRTEPLQDLLKRTSKEQEVRLLAERGIGVEEIAKALRIPRGEVELILSLSGGKKVL